MTKSLKIITIFAVSAIAIAVTFTLDPIAQDQAYHNFADKRGLYGISNFSDVMSNLFFIFFGIMGLYFLSAHQQEKHFTMQGEKRLWGLFFLSATLVGLGSGYYHLTPHNTTLVWDRLPMTLAFMTFFSLIIMERIHAKIGLLLCPILLLAGASSVFYWDYTESLGQGDLRPYALIQFLPLVLIPFIFWLFPARYNGLKYLGYTLGWYVLAKLLEHFDEDIFTLLKTTISGHSLKHIAAAMAVYTMFLYVKKRESIART